MNYEESVKYLFGLGNEVATMKLGLENISKLLAALGDPQNDYLKVQIAGTNGKGSTCAFLDAICISADIKTGLYTSPHLVSIRERIKIGGAEISENEFARHATSIRQIGEKLVELGEFEFVPTFFEQITAIALSAFRDAKIELAILETGLGGRFDATTAANAEIAAITPIDLDHQEILGDTLTKIAAEKAAIIRENTKVVVAPQTKEVSEVIRRHCREKNVVPYLAECEMFEQNSTQTVFKTEKYRYTVSKLGLEGKHQRQNACVAVNLAEILRGKFDFEISDSAIVDGLENARHAGRLEWEKIDGVNFLFDGAHNISGAKALREYLDEYVKQPITMIFGAMRDKDLAGISSILFPKADKLILTVPNSPRSLKIDELRKFVPENFSDDSLYFSDDPAVVLTIADFVSKENSVILITGSLYLVGEIQKSLKIIPEFEI